MAGLECSNCAAGDDGATRTLVVEGDRRLEVALCEPCYDEFVAEEWIEAAR
ncbi:hypothetical protein HWV07_07670 [Natronomonas salina]|uniref:hypothetical protein n=1 Tax=Natronomonas salina TaxID=1710540 RepID=UPI0015B409B3|nr:hypothetical protein [Natronomonas salina]QLD88913.1 hypothetical protein HWV07_07670 [Natronomonas salina]